MKINRNSWHYRFMVDFYNFDEPRSLCGYFWKLLLCIVMTLLFAAALLCLSPLLAVGFGIVLLADWCQERRSRRYWARLDAGGRAARKEPGIVVSYIKAAKNKVCPLIKYHD